MADSGRYSDAVAQWQSKTRIYSGELPRVWIYFYPRLNRDACPASRLGDVLSTGFQAINVYEKGQLTSVAVNKTLLKDFAIANPQLPIIIQTMGIGPAGTYTTQGWVTINPCWQPDGNHIGSGTDCAGINAVKDASLRFADGNTKFPGGFWTNQWDQFLVDIFPDSTNSWNYASQYTYDNFTAYGRDTVNYLSSLGLTASSFWADWEDYDWVWWDASNFYYPTQLRAYFLHHNASDIGGSYKSLIPIPSDDPSAVSPQSESVLIDVNDGETPIRAFAATASKLTRLFAGQWRFTTYAGVSLDGVASIIIRVYKRSSLGAETELFNLTSDPITTTGGSATLNMTYTNNDPNSWPTGGNISLETDDRIVVKYSAQTTSLTKMTVTLNYEIPETIFYIPGYTFRMLYEIDNRFDYPSATPSNERGPFQKIETYLGLLREARFNAIGDSFEGPITAKGDPLNSNFYDMVVSRSTRHSAFSSKWMQAYGRKKGGIQIYAYTGDAAGTMGRLHNIMFAFANDITAYAEVNVHVFDVWFAPNIGGFAVNDVNKEVRPLHGSDFILDELDNPDDYYQNFLKIGESIAACKAAMALGAIKLMLFNRNNCVNHAYWSFMIAYDEMQQYHEIIKYGTNYIVPVELSKAETSDTYSSAVRTGPYYGIDYNGAAIPSDVWISCRTYGNRMLFYGMSESGSTATYQIRSPANTQVAVSVSLQGTITVV